MEVVNEFKLDATIEESWDFLQQIERVAPCMPGAELLDKIDDHTWSGRVHTSFGPVALVFSGTMTVTQRDAADHRIVFEASGREQRGKGVAKAAVISTLAEHEDGGTKVSIVSDVQLSGAIAQLSRGLLPEVSRKLTHEFATHLQAAMATSRTDTAAATPWSSPASDVEATAKVRPIRAGNLILSALRMMLSKALRRCKHFLGRGERSTFAAMRPDPPRPGGGR